MSRDLERTALRDRFCGTLDVSDVGERVALCGWVARRREHGEHLAFVDLRDHTGLVQCVIDNTVDVRSEFVLRVTGTVRRRPEDKVNEELPTGAVELGECDVEVLATAETPPFPIGGRTEPDEQVRYQWRYLDLRQERLQRNLRLRARLNAAIRAAFDRQGFCEVETPLLWAPTPEGAREFVIPSRLRHGTFYVLPQSPQLAKQLLMVGGFDRYYQIARCMRDEDSRADRQFEFTQLDVEASFVDQEDVFAFVTEAVLDAAEAATGERPGPIARLTWTECRDRYGTDKPDLRFGMELVSLTDAFAHTEVKALQAASVQALRLPGGAALTRARLDELTERAKREGAAGLAWFRVTTEGLDAPLARFLAAPEAAAITAVDGAGVGDLVLVVASDHATACAVLGALRVHLGAPPVGDGPHRYCWVTEFPLFEGVTSDGTVIPAHHPFTMPHLDDLDRLESDPLSVRSQSYDLVLNGWELGSGSIRIHRADVQRRIFAVLKMTDEEVESRFGFLLDAFRYGAPPHGGFAFGIDRLAAIFAGEENIREVVAFPKTQSGADLMTGAPAPIAPSQLRDLGLELRPTT
ncbi:MAG TPA: aspartate--tRNA ligase [Acidimicrobiales bacterium]|nr:aspartate--tRNA ligase [Acidimicrobiales bacterium]